MCGILGLISRNGQPLTSESINSVKSSLKRMNFRGPDGSGVVADELWMLGHVRLAIIDPAGGQQPITDLSTETTLSYNGEIYNHVDLRNELESLGHSFETKCDTEVVLRSYLQWGTSCVERFNGFFAFGIIDKRNNRVFCARDRVGIKPFYFSATDQYLCFGSTLPSVLKSINLPLEPDFEAMSHYLTTSKTIFGERTLVQNISALRPGHILTYNLDGGDISIDEYWSIPVIKESDKEKHSFDDVVQETKELIEDSVKKRLMTDVPLGGFLSGGLDSAIISVTADKYAPFKLPLFCAGSDEEASNEFVFAHQVANQIGCDLTEIHMTHEMFMEHWSTLISNKGLPLSTPNEVSIYNLAHALSDHCKVTLTGEGADEIFGGYVQPHLSAYDYDRMPHDPESPEIESAFAAAIMLESGRNFFFNDTDHYTSTSCWVPYGTKSKLFNHDVWQSIDEDEAVFCYYEDFFEKLEGCTTLDKRLHLHANFNLESLLSRVDNCTMSASVEARVPFNDHRLIEFAFKQPDSYKYDWKSDDARNQGKYLTAAYIDKFNLMESKRLPRTAFKKLLPDDIINRKKMSFPVPFQKWFFGPLCEDITRMCINSSLLRNYLEFETVKQMILTLDRNFWLVANLCRWWDVMNEEYID